MRSGWNRPTSDPPIWTTLAGISRRFGPRSRPCWPPTNGSVAVRHPARATGPTPSPKRHTTPPPPAASERSGAQIGPYKLLELIGEGGMGTVWMAQQTEPVKRLVAVKLIKPGMDSRQVIARFEAERQALALMDHPHIAR